MDLPYHKYEDFNGLTSISLLLKKLYDQGFFYPEYTKQMIETYYENFFGNDGYMCYSILNLYRKKYVTYSWAKKYMKLATKNFYSSAVLIQFDNFYQIAKENGDDPDKLGRCKSH